MRRARLALGTAQLGLDYGVANGNGRPSAADVDRILRTALDLGVSCIDTAAAYGDAEVAVGRFLRATPGASVMRVCTKTPRFAPGLPQADLARELARSIDRSRERLGRDTIDDLLIHAVDNLREYGPVLVELLAEHAAAGRVGRIGVSVYDGDDVRLALQHPPLAVTQFPFNVFSSTLAGDGLVDDLRRAGHVTFARSVLLQGLLTLDPDQGDAVVRGSGVWLARFRAACARYGIEPLAAALAYAALESCADFVVIGVESTSQLRHISGLLAADLPIGLVADLASEFADVPVGVRDPRLWTGRAP